MSANQHHKSIILVVVIGIVLICVLQLGVEMVDLPHQLFGTPETPENYAEALLEVSTVLLVGAVMILLIYRLERHVRKLEKFIVVCSGCKKVRVDDKWISFEEFLQIHSGSSATHGMCDDCLGHLYPDIADEVREKCKKDAQ